MKAVYIHKICLNLKINGVWKRAQKFYAGYTYLYGEVPENTIDKFENKDDEFSELIKFCGYTDSCKTFWRKRVYITVANSRRIYKDELEDLEKEHIYTIVENPTIEKLKRDLGFKGYSQLVFDREQELKNMLISKA